MQQPVVVGIVDSGIAEGFSNLKQTARFSLNEQGEVQHQAGNGDSTGHGTAAAEIIAQHCANVQVYSAQVLDQQGRSSVAQVAAAIDWLVTQSVQVINLSLGLAADRPLLAEACERAKKAGVLLLASSPAMGQAVYPAAYESVLSVTGDARCTVDEWSWLQGMADFGGHVRGPHPHAGASMACAHVTGIICAFLMRNPLADQQVVLHYLHTQTQRIGPQLREPLPNQPR